MEIEKYLQNKTMGYEHLTPPERSAISGFALMWSLFEAQMMDEYSLAIKIVSKSKQWVDSEGIDEEFIDDHLEYFRNRYLDGDEFGYRFKHLHFRDNDFEPLVRDVLIGNVQNLYEKLACCLLIVHRFRNNFFHGTKWAYEFKEQQENLERSCSLLAFCLDTYS